MDAADAGADECMGVCLLSVCESADVLYRTTNHDYGLRGPTVHTAPSTYWPRYNKFTEVRISASTDVVLESGSQLESELSPYF